MGVADGPTQVIAAIMVGPVGRLGGLDSSTRFAHHTRALGQMIEGAMRLGQARVVSDHYMINKRPAPRPILIIEVRVFI